MRKKVISILLVVFISFHTLIISCSCTIEPTKETFVYAIKEKDSLRLDKYETPPYRKDRPCVIFVFGGGFKDGSRDSDFNEAYLKSLAQSGYVAIGIDYRLGLKDLTAEDASSLEKVAPLLVNAIQMSVEDLFDATRFVYEHADEWRFDKTKIVANGSSAGAVAVLQGEYWVCNKSEIAKKLPENFCYGGIIAFAGGIFTETDGLKWSSKPVPMQLFHGDADKNVPYNKIELSGIGGLYGSNYIAKQLKDMQAPHYYYNVVNAAHEIASVPMVNNLEDIRTFINKYVVNHEPLIIQSQSREISKPEMKKNFTLMDYIDTNYQ